MLSIFAVEDLDVLNSVLNRCNYMLAYSSFPFCVLVTMHIFAHLRVAIVCDESVGWGIPQGDVLLNTNTTASYMCELSDYFYHWC